MKIVQLPFLFFSLLFAVQTNAQVNLNAGLVGYYPFNGNFSDQSGNGNNGVPQNGATFGTDQWGNANSAAFFDGFDDWVSIAPSASISPSKHFSIAFRFKSNNASYGQVLFAKADYTVNPNNYQYHIGFNYSGFGTNGLWMGTRHQGNCTSSTFLSDNYVIDTTNIINSNQWYCVAMLFDNGVKSIYINGALAVQETVSTGPFPNQTDSCTAGSLRFGTWWAGDPEYFNGMLDEVRIYNRALNTSEIDSICNYVNQPEITINDYAAVFNYDPCQNTFTVDTATSFVAGDTILVMQMKGATIDTSNTASFGNILSYNGSGNYEYNVVKNVSGNVISLVYNLHRSYDIPNGKVQLVKVPYYPSYTVSQPHTCIPWNGSKGGVFAINVGGTLTVNDNINVSEKGFMGGNGNPVTTGTYYCNVSNYYVSSNIDSASNKGEGITTVSSYKMKGRGALANGGGGGNGHNGGGGGGSNGNTGGTGGYQYSFCPGANAANNTIGGIGGKNLNYSNTSNKVFMGGGGGAGQSNDGTATFGGNGGGIVLINANSLVGNSGSIVANGQDAPGCAFTGGPACHDGMGGGGGAGTVILNVNAATGNIPVIAKGGKGANMAGDIINGRVGPGGGGSGGVLWMKGGTVPASVITALNGGANGVILYDGDSYGAQPGQPGATVTGLQLSFPTDSFKTINYSFNDSFLTCRTFLFTAVNNGSVAAAQFQWQFGDGTTGTGNPVAHTYATNGSYVVTLIVSDSVGCSDTITQTISVNGATADFTISNNTRIDIRSFTAYCRYIKAI
jgi:hypothetical protein